GGDRAELGLARSIGRAVVTLTQCLRRGSPAVVVGEVEMCHAEIEGTPDDRALSADRSVVAEVLPQPERDCRKVNPALATATVRNLPIAVWRRNVCHGHAVCHGSRRHNRSAPALAIEPTGRFTWSSPLSQPSRCPGGSRP